jgi:hypothetical protein
MQLCKFVVPNICFKRKYQYIIKFINISFGDRQLNYLWFLTSYIKSSFCRMNDTVDLWNTSFLIYIGFYSLWMTWFLRNAVCALGLLISVYYNTDMEIHYNKVHAGIVTVFCSLSRVSLLKYHGVIDVICHSCTLKYIKTELSDLEVIESRSKISLKIDNSTLYTVNNGDLCCTIQFVFFKLSFLCYYFNLILFFILFHY